MAESTHNDIIKRIDALEEDQEGLEERMKVVEHGVIANGKTALDLKDEFIAHRSDFNERMARWDGIIIGVGKSAQSASWVIGILVGIAALVAAFT